MLKKGMLITQPYDSLSHSLRRSHTLALPKSTGLLKSQQGKNLPHTFSNCQVFKPCSRNFVSGIRQWLLKFIHIFLCCELITYSVSSMRKVPFSLFALLECSVFQIRRTLLGWIYLTVSNFQWNLSPFWSWQAQRLSSKDCPIYLMQQLQNFDFQLPEKHVSRSSCVLQWFLLDWM